MTYVAEPSNRSAVANTGFGNTALAGLTTGTENSGFGASALTACTTGSHNVAYGDSGLDTITTGSYNTSIGSGAGSAQTTSDSSNILLGYGTNGTSGVSNALVVGSATGTGNGNINSATICGIDGKTSASGVEVFINASNVLGTSTSSIRFKDNVKSLPLSTDVVRKLRPVSFNYKEEILEARNEEDVLQYGFIAEEVEQIDRNLVAYDHAGKPYAIRKHFFIPMLVAEIQRLSKQVDFLMSQITEKDR